MMRAITACQFPMWGRYRSLVPGVVYTCHPNNQNIQKGQKKCRGYSPHLALRTWYQGDYDVSFPHPLGDVVPFS